MSCCNARIKSMENISKWKYQGSDCIMHGPYDSLLMLKWISLGYFDESTVVQDVRFDNKMLLKMAVINLKEDAIRHAKSILSCPHHTSQIYAIATNEASQTMELAGVDERTESVSTSDHSARSDFSMQNVPIVYRNIPNIDNINIYNATITNNTSNSHAKINNSDTYTKNIESAGLIDELNINNIDGNDTKNKELQLDSEIKYCKTNIGQFLEMPKDKNYLQNAMFLPRFNNDILDLSPKSDKSNVASTSPKTPKVSGVETILGLDEAERHLKRIEKHKISGYLEKIMCMGTDIHIVGQLN